jgi:hypothetical protein
MPEANWFTSKVFVLLQQCQHTRSSSALSKTIGRMQIFCMAKDLSTSTSMLSSGEYHEIYIFSK